MYNDCLDGKIDCIITKSISRFARNTYDCIDTIRKLTVLGVNVIFERKNINTKSMNSTLRRLNSQRSVFPSDTALLKALYLATFEAAKKWTLPLRNWGKVYGELFIMYEGRLI